MAPSLDGRWPRWGNGTGQEWSMEMDMDDWDLIAGRVRLRDGRGCTGQNVLVAHRPVPGTC